MAGNFIQPKIYARNIGGFKTRNEKKGESELAVTRTLHARLFPKYLGRPTALYSPIVITGNEG